MRIKDLFSGSKKVLTPIGISRMGRLHDVEGLVHSLDHIEKNLRSRVLDELIALSEKGRFDMMIQCGIIGKLMPIFNDGTWNEKKRAALLLSSFILHKRMNQVLRHDWTIKELISQMSQADDTLRKNLVYCVYEFCRSNMGHQVVYNNGIQALVGAMRTDDPDIHYWSLFSLSIIASLGYQELILKTDLLPMLNRDLSSLDGEVHSLAEMLRDGLYNWKDKDTIPEDRPTIGQINKMEGYEDLGVIDGYQRPDQISERPRTTGKGALTSIGGKVRDIRDDDIEMVLDIDSTTEKARPAIIYTNEDENEDDFELEV